MIGHDVKFEESHFLFYNYFLTDINSTDILRTQKESKTPHVLPGILDS